MKRGILLIVLFCIPFVFADPSDCEIALSCKAGFSAFGNVTSDGHFLGDSINQGQYLLCCNSSLAKGAGTASFRYAAYDSSINGSGHVSINSTATSFTGQMMLGFPRACTLKNSCDAMSNEICIFKVCTASPSCRLDASQIYRVDNSPIADCNTLNTPFDNSYTTKLCCKTGEICSDGIDNDGDGYIDCADSDCHQTATNPTPALCINSPYNATTCVNLTRNVNLGTYEVTYNSLCNASDNQIYYCSYSDSGTGVCCGSGTVATQDAFGNWKCIDSTPCMDPVLIANYPCKFDFDDSRNNWLLNPYNGDGTNWCVSRMPALYTEEGTKRSTGCCLIVKSGEVDYYTDDDNVKIFGTSP
jgi:hypothetical protein